MPKSQMPGASTPTACRQWDSSWPKLVEPDRANDVWAYFRTRFGLSPEIPHRLVLREGRSIYWVLSKADALDVGLKSLKVVSAGIPLARRVKDRYKPTSAALRLLAPWLRRNRVYLSEEHVHHLFVKGPLPCSGSVSAGYVLLETDSGVLGCGLVAAGRLHSQIPKAETASYLGQRTGRVRHRRS
jgi:NOL1/NOP2/fmu family ribosome biogenesis protein